MAFKIALRVAESDSSKCHHGKSTYYSALAVRIAGFALIVAK